MVDSPEHERATRPDPLEVPHAWACLLPAFWLVLPTLHGVPTPDSAGVGWNALLSIPAAVLAIVREGRTRPRALGAWLLVVALAAFGRGRGEPPFDTFEADRAWMLLVTSLVMLLSGASLGARGRAILARGLALASTAWLVGAALDTLLDRTRAFAGVLENTGDLAAAALPGALIGLAAARTVGRIGWLAGLGWVAYGLLVPVHGTVLAGGFALALFLSLARPAAASSRRRALVALALLVVGFGARVLPKLGGGGQDDRPAVAAQVESAKALAQGTEDSGEAQGVDGSGDAKAPGGAGDAEGEAGSGADEGDGVKTGEGANDSSFAGVLFRTRTWARVPALLEDRLWSGVGTGQLPARFPIYRSAKDVAAASHGRRAPYETEVEDLHNDWLEHFAQLGLPGGLATLVFLAWALIAAIGALRSGDEVGAALGLATIGLLAQAATTSALLHAPASSVVGFTLIGTMLGRVGAEGRSARARRVQRLLALGVLALAAAPLQRALDFVRHGRALAALSGSALVEADGRVMHSAAAKAKSLETALAACPDSVVALTERAALQRALGAPADEQMRAWSRVLDLRPYHFEALVALGNLRARMGAFPLAQELYERAAQVDPLHPALLQCRLMVSIDSGDRAELYERLLDARPGIGIPLSWLRERAANCLRDGRPEVGNLLLQIVDPTLVAANGEEAYALQRRFAESDGALADGMLTWAHQAWGREHVSAGAYAVAVRSYRQSVRASREDPSTGGGAQAVRLELAAALVLAGRVEDARLELAGWRASPRSLRELPEWAGQALMDAGLLVR